MTRILIVEDEPIIAGALQDDLTLEGYDVTVIDDGAAGARFAIEHPVDLIVLDVMLPSRDGVDVCRDVRRAGLKTPILMLTARVQEAEKVLAFEPAPTITSQNHSGRGVARAYQGATAKS